jgi:hypothetical protein
VGAEVEVEVAVALGARAPAEVVGRLDEADVARVVQVGERRGRPQAGPAAPEDEYVVHAPSTRERGPA